MKKVILLLAVVFSINASAQAGLTSWAVTSERGACILQADDYEKGLSIQRTRGDAEVMFMIMGSFAEGEQVFLSFDGEIHAVNVLVRANGFALLSYDMANERWFSAFKSASVLRIGNSRRGVSTYTMKGSSAAYNAIR